MSAFMTPEREAVLRETLDSQADRFIRIPMCGFVESLNVSASVRDSKNIMKRFSASQQ